MSGPLYLAELLSTEFMTEQRARGDVLFSERLLQLGHDRARPLARNSPVLSAQGDGDRFAGGSARSIGPRERGGARRR